jgi:hypothetical protein
MGAERPPFKGKGNGPTWDRTRDLPVMSRWLCQLSYGPAWNAGFTGSHKNKFAILSVEAPDRQGAKAPAYQDMSSFRNAAGRDASALKNVN